MTDDDDDVGGEVICLRPDLERPPLAIVDSRGPTCSCIHGVVEVDPAMRTLRCDQCGANLEPFDFISQWTARWDNIRGWVKALSRERASLRAEVDKLKAERNRLRSSVAGLRRRRGEA